MTNSELTAQEQIEYLATKVMGWHLEQVADLENKIWFDGKQSMIQATHKGKHFWNPLTDWNHWRQVEEKVMESFELKMHFFEHFQGNNSEEVLQFYIEADLHTRVSALIQAHQELYPEAQ